MSALTVGAANKRTSGMGEGKRRRLRGLGRLRRLRMLRRGRKEIKGEPKWAGGPAISW
jgi:hypothetical protein